MGPPAARAQGKSQRSALEAKRLSAEGLGNGPAGQEPGVAIHLAFWLGDRCCHGNCQMQQRPQRAQERAPAAGLIMAISKAATRGNIGKYCSFEKEVQMRHS